MKVILCGQKRFGLLALQLCEQMGFDIVTVVTPIDDKVLQPYAEAAGYKIWPPVCIDDFWNVEHDLGITAHFFATVPQVSIRKANLGWIGYHPSLLPRHRGRSSIEWAMRMKDPITGGTLYWLNDGLDKGDIAYQDWIFLDHDKTIKEVWDEELMPMGLRLFKMAFADIGRGVISRKPQAPLEKFATSEPGLDVKKTGLTIRG